MRDDPGRNLKWLEQELLSEDEVFHNFGKAPNVEYDDDKDLLELVDLLIKEDEEEEWEEEIEPPIRNFANNYGREAKSVRAVRAQAPKKLEENAAIPVKTKRELRREAKQQKQAEKRASINRNIKGLVFLAALECLGILAILGWWLQWLI